MLLNLLNGGSGVNWQDYFVNLLLSLPVILLTFSIHGFALSYTADRLGDSTARNYGFVTMNPFKHLDPIGFLCMVFVGFGWVKSPPINVRCFKKPRRDMALTSLAGPISNLLLAVIFALLMRLVLTFCAPAALLTPATTNDYLWHYVWRMLELGMLRNIVFAVLSLIPVPPLVGSRLLFSILSPDQYFKLSRYEHYISIAMMVALFLGLLDTPINWITGIFWNLITRLIF